VEEAKNDGTTVGVNKLNAISETISSSCSSTQ
jgi:hypothetical protein